VNDQRGVHRAPFCDIGAFAAGEQSSGSAGTELTGSFEATGIGCPSDSAVSIDWGDGSAPGDGTVDCQTIGDITHATVTGTHTYAAGGYYHVLATLTQVSNPTIELAGGALMAAAAAVIMVNTTSDLAATSGECACVPDVPCSLRQAIDLANRDAIGDTVMLPAGAFQLTLGSSLPVSASMTISGAGAAVTGGSLTMTDVTFSQNGAAVGGALRIRSGTVAGTGVTFAGNFGEFGGGSVYIDGGSLTLTNSTFDGSAGLDGYGIGIQNAGGSVSLLNDTISGSQGYALETDQGASTTVENTIIAAGGRGDCVPANRQDSVTDATTAAAVTVDAGNNIDQNGDCGLSGPGDQTGDPVLATLADNGGPTKTDALLVGSPAIDAGNGDGCPPTDQRGMSRDSGCDVGAYAAQFLGDPSATTNEAQVNGSDDATLNATIDTAGEGGAYAFEWGTTLDLGNETPLVGAGIASGQTVQADLPDLLPAHTYYFSAVAENASGRSQGEVLSFTTSAAAPTVSDAAASDVFDTTATAGGSVDPSGDVTSYWVEYGQTADLGSQTAATPIGSTPGGQSVEQALNGLDPGTLYYARIVASTRIVASNPEGTTDGTMTTFTTGPQFEATSGVVRADGGVWAADGCAFCGFGHVGAGGDGDAFGAVAGDGLSRAGGGDESGWHVGELGCDVYDDGDGAAAAGARAELGCGAVLGERAGERAAVGGGPADPVRLDHRCDQRHGDVDQHRPDRAAAGGVVYRCGFPGGAGG
jgi:hypothetical protein